MRLPWGGCGVGRGNVGLYEDAASRDRDQCARNEAGTCPHGFLLELSDCTRILPSSGNGDGAVHPVMGWSKIRSENASPQM